MLAGNEVEGLCHPHELLDQTVAGAKAYRLQRLSERGYRVPPFLVLTPDLCRRLIEDRRLGTAVAESVHRHLKVNAYAIRSSALVEDGERASLAGQFRTEIDVSPENIAAAIERVLAHAREFLHGDLSKFALIIQAYIAPEFFGVTFTRHPLALREMVVEMHWGRGDQLVGGQVKPERHVLPWQTKIDERTLGFPSGVGALVQFRRIELDSGHPQDIEWCVSGGKLYFLQTRPLTTLSPHQLEEIRYLDEHLPHDGAFVYEKNEISEIAPNPCRLTFDLLDSIYAQNGPVDRVYREHGIRYEALPFLVLIGNRLFIDRELELKSLFPNATLLKSQSLAPRFTLARGAWRSIGNALAFVRLLGRASETRIAKLRERLLAKFYEPIATGTPREAFAGFLDDYRLIFELNLLAASAAKRLEVHLKREKMTLAALSGAWSLFLDAHESVDVTLPTTELRGNGLELADESPFYRAPSQEGGPLAEVEQWWQGLSTFRREALKGPIRAALRLEQLREVGRWLTVVKINQVRECCLEAAWAVGFSEPRLVYHARLLELLEGRLSEYDCYLAKARFDRLEHLKFPSLLSDRDRARPERWVCLSPGRAEGRLISWEELRNRVENASLVEGESLILYTQVLHPEIAAYFRFIKGLVSDSGGLLSHLSILAREAGVPALAQVRLSPALALGDQVRLDATASTIQRVPSDTVRS